MSAPLPEALRAQLQTLIEDGFSGRAAALHLELSPATGARWGLAIRRTGAARPAPQGRPKRRGKLDPHGIFLPRSSARTATSRGRIWPRFCSMRPVSARIPIPWGGSFASWAIRTKKSTVVAERRRAKVEKQREGWFKHRVPAVPEQPERVVFIDETSVKANMARQRRWSPRRRRLVIKVPFGAWRILSEAPPVRGCSDPLNHFQDAFLPSPRAWARGS